VNNTASGEHYQRADFVYELSKNQVSLHDECLRLMPPEIQLYT
jgi:hypothetical protein